MLELPESHTLARQLCDTVLDRRITKVVAAASPHRFSFYTADPADYPEMLEGRSISHAAAVGGLVELSLGEMRLTLGDGVNLRLLESAEKRSAKHQLLLELDSEQALICTVQMYGGLWAFQEGTNDNFYYLVAKERPNPLDEAFDAAYFEGLLSAAKPTLSAKAFLATEQRIPGLGNGVLQDILFTARIHPKSKLGALSSGETDILYQSVKGVLADMARYGGRNTERDLFGAQGGYGTVLSNKTWKGPCPVCGGGLVRQAYLGGNVYFCPHCQPLKG